MACNNITLPAAPAPVTPPVTPSPPASTPSPDIPAGRPQTAVDIPNSYIRESNGFIYNGENSGAGAIIGTSYITTKFDAIFAQGGLSVYNDGEIVVCITNFSPSYPSDTFAKVDVDNGGLVITPTYQTVHVPGGGTVYATFGFVAAALGTYSVTITVGNASATFNLVCTSAGPGTLDPNP